MFNLLLQASNSDYLITISVRELVIALFWFILCIAMLVVVMILFKFYQSVKDFRLIVKENRENINKIMEEIPGITKSINAISSDIEHTTNAFMPSVDSAAEISNSFMENIKNNNPLNEFIASCYSVVANFKKLLNAIIPNSDDVYYEIRPVNKDDKDI